LGIMPLSDFVGWPKAYNGVGDGKVLFGEGEKPPRAQYIQDALAGTSAFALRLGFCSPTAPRPFSETVSVRSPWMLTRPVLARPQPSP
jgi:hypothetical protein